MSVLDHFNKIRGLKQYEGVKDEELLKIAKIKYKEHQIDIGSMFTNPKERKIARELLRKYIDDYSIDTVSDQNAVKQIVYLEVINNRLQDKMNLFSKDDTKAVPVNIMHSIHSNLDAITKLKTNLNILRKEEKSDQYDGFKLLGKKFKKWLKENQASRTLICPCCGKMVLLRIRTEHWEAQKHPFFKDRVIYNEHLIKLYKDKIITKEDVSKVLEVSTDYVEWVIRKIEKTNNGTVQENNNKEINKDNEGISDSSEESGKISSSN